jgi:hypothetical protein
MSFKDMLVWNSMFVFDALVVYIFFCAFLEAMCKSISKNLAALFFTVVKEYFAEKEKFLLKLGTTDVADTTRNKAGKFN